jgi:tetratricopeptide (TPR) repeat protein
LDQGSLQLIELAYVAAGAPEQALPYVDSVRWQWPLDVALDEHGRLGVVAYGYALAGDLRSAREILAVMDSVFENSDFQPRRGIGEAVLALITLQEGRERDAVEHLLRARAESFGYLHWDYRLFLADAQAALGHLSEAIAQYDTVTSTYRMAYPWAPYFALRPLAHERLGSLYLEVDDTVSAARHLAEFIELWKDADPELQPRVDAARRRLAQLVVEGTG